MNNALLSAHFRIADDTEGTVEPFKIIWRVVSTRLFRRGNESPTLHTQRN